MGYFRLAVFVALWLFSPCAHALKVLFVGNSFVQYSVPTLQRFLQNNPNSQDTFGYEAVGGITLSEHARRETTLARIRDGAWDYVVLQDHSTQSIRHPDQFSLGIETLVAATRESCAQPILLQTWARLQTGNYPGDQITVSRAYLDLGNRLSVPVARVGDLWFDMYQNQRSIFTKMFDPDGIHPTDFGTFAVAISIYSVLYNEPLDWVPTAGVGTAGSTLRASALRLNTPLAPHSNTGNCSAPKPVLNAITLLLLD